MENNANITLSLRDTKANVCEEILSALYYSEQPMSVQSIRKQLKDRYGWMIGVKSVQNFIDEMMSSGKIANADQVGEGSYTLTKGERDVRGGRCFADAKYDGGSLYGRKGRGPRDIP